MLAPRKKLWSTPMEVIEKAIELLKVTDEDLVYDIGAGDGRFIMKCCEDTGATCVGVEIDSDRGEEAVAAIHEKSLTKCRMIIGNALEQDYSEATCIFMYLIPRGLSIMLPILQSALKGNTRVVTYMSPLSGLEPIEIVKVSTAAHPDAQWPLYLYNISKKEDNYNIPTEPIPDIIDSHS